MAIDITKKYTCGGKRVVALQIVTHNACGQKVTYPVKGSVVVREKPLKLEYRIWSIDGIADVVWGKGDNLVPSMKVLVVEDDKDIAKLMELAIREYSPQAEIIVAMTCERALKELTADISLVFTDLIGCDGYTIIKEALKLGIKTVACTGRMLNGPEDICFVELLQKPFELKELKKFLI